MNREMTLLAVLATASLALPARGATYAVSVRDNSFSPSTLTICVGDSVLWTNDGSMLHTTTSGSGCTPDGRWDSGNLFSGDSFSRVFTAADQGSNAYYCIPHCDFGMTGTITVVTGASSGLGTPVSKLRIGRPSTEGLGGTIKGTESFSGATYDDVQPNSVSLTLTIAGTRASDLVPFSHSQTVTLLTDARGNHAGAFPENGSLRVNILGGKISGGHDPASGKVLVKYLTHGIDLADLVPGSLTSTVEILQTVAGACGLQDVMSSSTTPVQL